MVKLHVAPLDGDIVWVSAHSAISEACSGCKATDLSQLPFFKAAALAGALQEVCSRRLYSECAEGSFAKSDPTRRRSCEVSQRGGFKGLRLCRRPLFSHSNVVVRQEGLAEEL